MRQEDLLGRVRAKHHARTNTHLTEPLTGHRPIHPLSLTAFTPFFCPAVLFFIIAPAHWVVERTYFKHFVAGKNLSESLRTAAKLSTSRIGTILDYSIESAEGNVEEVVDVLVESVRLSAETPYTPFSCFKVTALAHPHLLRRINQILEYQKVEPSLSAASDLMDLIKSNNWEAHVRKMIEQAKRNGGSWLRVGRVEEDDMNFPKTDIAKAKPPAALTLAEMETMLLPFVRRLERLGEAVHQHDHAVLVDAEQSYFQEAIHFAAKCLMTRYNKTQPRFYNTYQMYLKAAPAKLQEDINYAQENNLIIGAKLVRGAYMDGEAIWAKEKGVENPIHPTIEDTHAAYNVAMSLMLDLAKQNKGAVVIATHNERSLLLGSQGLAERGMSASHPYVHFGQLYGMCDHISLSLSQNGHNVVKYVPFGPVSEVMPYLLRRVAENRGFLASTKREQGLMLEELKDRFRITPHPQPSL